MEFADLTTVKRFGYAKKCIRVSNLLQCPKFLSSGTFHKTDKFPRESKTLVYSNWIFANIRNEQIDLARSCAKNSRLMFLKTTHIKEVIRVLKILSFLQQIVLKCYTLILIEVCIYKFTVNTKY